MTESESRKDPPFSAVLSSQISIEELDVHVTSRNGGRPKLGAPVRWAAPLAVPLALASPTAGLAQLLPDGPQFLVNSYTPQSQERPSVDVDALGNLVAVWPNLGSYGDDHDNFSVQARLFDAAGQWATSSTSTTTRPPTRTTRPSPRAPSAPSSWSGRGTAPTERTPAATASRPAASPTPSSTTASRPATRAGGPRSRPERGGRISLRSSLTAPVSERQ